MKKAIAIMLSFVVLFTASITAYASEIQPYSNNVSTTSTTFSISGSGLATATNTYSGITGRTKSAKNRNQDSEKSRNHLGNCKRRKLDGYFNIHKFQQEPFRSAFKYRNIQSSC